jgi:hypothetical protein
MLLDLQPSCAFVGVSEDHQRPYVCNGCKPFNVCLLGHPGALLAHVLQLSVAAPGSCQDFIDTYDGLACCTCTFFLRITAITSDQIR